MARPQAHPTSSLSLAVMIGLLFANTISPQPAAARSNSPSTPIEIHSGELIAKITTRADPKFSYALYLPSGYSPEKTWPTLFLFDARGRGTHAAERFVPAAEKYGWILVSSNDSRSDETVDPNVAAMQAMLADARKRFAIDLRRLYASGFSGGARAACLMGLAFPDAIAGVIGASGGFPLEQRPDQNLPFGFFGTVGDLDFNYYEMQLLDRDLADLGLRHRLAVFEGTHQWMPTELATEAIEWMEIQAMRSARRAKDPSLAATIAKERANHARALESTQPLDARLAWEALVEDFTEVIATDEPALVEARERAKKLATDPAISPTIAKAKRLRDQSIRRDLEQIRRAQQALAAVSPENAASNLGRLLTFLRIRDLKNQAKSPDHDQSLSAQRVLATYRVQTSFYLPREFMARKDWTRAELCLEIATEIESRDEEVWLHLAEVRAQSASKKRALAALERAIEEGLKSRELIEANELLAPLRSEERFRELVSKMGDPVTPP